MATPLQLAIVGCGDIARYTAFFARLNRRVALSACCDRDLARARQFARRFNIPHVYENYAQLLAEAPCEALYLATPHHLHAEMIAAAIARRIPVWVEKPLAHTLEAGREIVAQAQAAGVPVGVNYQYRYDRALYTLARAVQAGALGVVHAARLNLPWRRGRAYFTQSAWHASAAQAGGGTLLTQGSHLLDAALWAIDRPARSALGYTARRVFQDVEVEDLAQAVIELEGGALVQISSSMVANPEGALEIAIYGDRGTAVYTDKPWPRLSVRGARLARVRPPHWGLHALQRSLEGFRAWVQDGQPYLCPAAQALPALAAVTAIYASAGSGSRVKIEPNPTP